MYKIYSELYQCEYFGIPHEKDYTISMEKILSNITHDTDLVILTNQIVRWVSTNHLMKYEYY